MIAQLPLNALPQLAIHNRFMLAGVALLPVPDLANVDWIGYIGAYFAALGGADAIIFGGGIGEHSANVRGAICSGLKRLGVMLDPSEIAKQTAASRISADGSPVEIHVIPLDEELYMARAAALLLGNRKAQRKPV